MPTEPGKKAIGMNTPISTKVMPTMAPVICPMALRVASLGGKPSSDMMRSTFSTTTIASSTRIPIANTMAKSVKTLIEKPASKSTIHVPSSATGTTRVGMMV